mmetsp:Transcript_26006/g.49058  ORF Transcript_26006/g.49058 Transcript_26006/m.49058 type:complete len:214 (-) Transcript_26006:78-719(-)
MVVGAVVAVASWRCGGRRNEKRLHVAEGRIPLLQLGVHKLARLEVQEEGLFERHRLLVPPELVVLVVHPRHTSPKIDDQLALVVHGQLSAHLQALVEQVLEGRRHVPELRLRETLHFGTLFRHARLASDNILKVEERFNRRVNYCYVDDDEEAEDCEEGDEDPEDGRGRVGHVVKWRRGEPNSVQSLFWILGCVCCWGALVVLEWGVAGLRWR